jgi:hypothetical protein
MLSVLHYARIAAGSDCVTTLPAAGSPTSMALITSSREASISWRARREMAPRYRAATLREQRATKRLRLLVERTRIVQRTNNIHPCSRLLRAFVHEETEASLMSLPVSVMFLPFDACRDFRPGPRRSTKSRLACLALPCKPH